jgi:superfamily II DNA or RNA helicase
MGFHAYSIDGPGDRGGDILCEINGEVWVLQVKWKKRGTVPESAVDQVLEARNIYSAHQAIVVSNVPLSRQAEKLVKNHARRGIGVGYWGKDFLEIEATKSENKNLKSFPLRCYQKTARDQIIHDLDTRGSALLFLATGLGKTVVAGSVINHFFQKRNAKKVLVLAHMTDLIQQLQISFWSFLGLSINTQLVDQLNKPTDFEGLTISTNMSILPIIENGYRPDLIVIDECHHVGSDNTYNKIIEMCSNIPLLGVTATPWRGDKFDITETFGHPSASCDMEEGIRQGYLSNVKYKLFCDNVNWDIVPSLSNNEYSIKHLNRKLFIPQRDESVIDELLLAFNEVVKPKCVVFCQSIEHAERLFSMIMSIPKWSGSALLHSNLSHAERRSALIKFRGHECPLLLAVDILNEGVDIPSVNIVCFARVTHSRKIFIQQLGRGLRITDTKSEVVVLDFAADIRRAAAIKKMQNVLTPVGEVNTNDGDIEILENYGSTIEFNDKKAETLLDEWIKDVASLDTASDEAKLKFPGI